MDKHCNAFKSTGHWRGYRCGNNGEFEHDGKMYCYAHIGKAQLGEYNDVAWDSVPAEEV